VQAQQPQPREANRGSDALEEVLVTARGREEDLQEVPLAITVLSNEALIERGIVDARDVAQFSPSLSFYSGSGRADLTALVVRGLSPQTSDERYQGLSIFVDGIYVSGQLAGIDLSQLQRVEILKGPQSAKYGRATYSGAIDYITRTPDSNEVEGSLRGRFSGHGSGSASSQFYAGQVSLPIKADAVWLSVNATTNRVGGRYPNTGRDGDRIGEEKTDSVGATLFSRFGDGASLKLRYALDLERDSAPLATVVQPTDWGGRPYDIPGLYTISAVNPITSGCPTACAGIGTVWINGDIPNTGAGLVGTDVTTSFPVGFLPASYPDRGGRDRRREFVSLLYEQTLGNYELSYRGGYFEQEYWALEDFRRRAQVNDPVFGPLGVTGAAKTGFTPAFEELFRNQSHQLRLASPGEGRLRWSAGLYYFDELNRNRGVAAASPGVTVGVVRRSRGLERFENQAAFGDVAFDVTDRLTLTLEGRYQQETVFYDACDAATCPIVNPVNRSAKNSAFLPRITAQFRINEDLNSYAYYSKGEKSGRFNQSAAAFNYAFIPPEELDNFELGLKSALFDRRLILNASLFYQQVTGQQLLVAVPNPLCTFNPVTGAIVCPPGQTQPQLLSGVQAVGDSDVYGAELEGRWQVTDQFSLTYGLGYARHEFSDAIGPFRNTDPQLFLPGETLKGKTSINTPRTTGNVSAEYRMPLGGDRFGLRMRADALYTGRRYIDLANRASIEGVVRFNARISLTGGDGAWDASFFGKDLTDEDTLLGAGLTGSSGCYYPETPLPAANRGTQLCQFVGIPRGRELGLELSYRF